MPPVTVRVTTFGVRAAQAASQPPFAGELRGDVRSRQGRAGGQGRQGRGFVAPHRLALCSGAAAVGDVAADAGIFM